MGNRTSKDGRWWGCPECGEQELIQRVTFSGTRDVVLEGDRRPVVTELGEDKRSVDDLDDTENEYECVNCGHAFNEPARILSSPERKYRVTMEVKISVFYANLLKGTDYLVEEEDTALAGAEVVDVGAENCDQAKWVAENLLRMVRGAAESVK